MTTPMPDPAPAPMEALLPCPFCGESNAIICTTDYLETKAQAEAKGEA